VLQSVLILCIQNLINMTTNEKNAVEKHLLRVVGANPTTLKYKMLKKLFDDGELAFVDVDRDDAIALRKELWFMHFECQMQLNKILITDDAVVKYYETVLGLKAEPIE